MYAYSGILTALLREIDVGPRFGPESLAVRRAGEWMSAPAYYTAYGGSAPRRTGAHHASIAPYETVTTRARAVQIYLAIQNGREWTRFCGDVLGGRSWRNDPRFASNRDRVTHRAALR